jgi:hypothetical protein
MLPSLSFVGIALGVIPVVLTVIFIEAWCPSCGCGKMRCCNQPRDLEGQGGRHIGESLGLWVEQLCTIEELVGADMVGD